MTKDTKISIDKPRGSSTNTLKSMVESLNKEFRDSGITVKAMAPSPTGQFRVDFVPARRKDWKQPGE